MNKCQNNERKSRFLGTYYTWLIGQRNGVYFADGRSNQPDLGRHSLGTRDRREALDQLKQLDLVKAVENGRADRSLLADATSCAQLDLEEGRRLYDEHVRRPRVTGGAKPTTAKRYRPILNKFLVFARTKGVAVWNAVSARLLQEYAAWLEDEDYAYRTEYSELTTIKQALKWLVESGHLPATCRLKLPLAKAEGTDTYCWRREEVDAMLAHCRTQPKLAWLADVLVALACTGLRISELAALRWSDIDLSTNMISLTDESTQARRARRHKAREIKNRRSRSFPIHADLLSVLKALPRRPDGLIFQGPRSGVIKPDTVRNILIADVLESLQSRFPTPAGDVGFGDGRLRSFRHYFCSVCANSNVPEQVVMRWLGHQNSAMVRHYYHLHDDEAQRQMKRLKFVDGAGCTDAVG